MELELWVFVFLSVVMVIVVGVVLLIFLCFVLCFVRYGVGVVDNFSYCRSWSWCDCDY